MKQTRKEKARHDYEVNGLSIEELTEKYGYKKNTLNGYVSREKWQKNIKVDLKEVSAKTETHLVKLGVDIHKIEEQLFGDEYTSDEVGALKRLATVAYVTAIGKTSLVKKTYSVGIDKETGEETLEEKYREETPIAPDVRAGKFYLELSDKIATMGDIGEFETDEELEARYKGYEENLKREREIFENRVIDE